MRALINIFMLAGLLLIQACSNKEEIGSVANSQAEVKFSASILNKEAIQARALNDEKGDIVPLPYISGIYVRKIGTELATAEYKVASGHKGTLVNIDNTPIKWDASLTTPIRFYGWTTPTGVTISADATTSGTVDFILGNTYVGKEDKDKVNEVSVTPLEAFIGCPIVSSTREASPSVTLPFKHLVSKLSIRVRDWNNQVVTKDVSITFLGIKDQWSLGLGKDDNNGIQIKSQVESASLLKFDCSNSSLGNDEKTSGFKRIYLPPLTTALGTDFKTAGDFCIELNNKQYYGTLNNVGQNITELQAGEHLHVTMDLSENFGVGVGTRIVDWRFGEEDIIEGNPYKGIYTYEDLKSVAEAVNAGKSISPLLIDDDGVIRLYRNIQLEDDWVSIGTNSNAFKLEFDGNGYVISGLNYTAVLDDYAGVFGYVEGAKIKNLTLSNCVVTGNGTEGAGLLIGEATGATSVENCHVIGASSVTNTSGNAGGLIGTAGSGVTIENCSVETSGAVTGTTAGVLVGESEGIIRNCFAVFAAEATVGLVGSVSVSGNGSISYSYFWNTFDDMLGNFWGSAVGTITFDKDNVYKSSVKISGATDSTPLLEALQVGSSGKDWVYVYGKGYPVLKIN